MFALLLSGAALPAASRAQVRVRSDTLREFRTQRIPNGRMDTEENVLRARYRMSPRAGTLSPDAVLRSESNAFGWSPDLEDLKLVTDRSSGRARHVTYQQYFKGIPVEGRFVKINMDEQGQATMVFSGYSRLRPENTFSIAPGLSSDDALLVARSLFQDRGGKTSEPHLVVHPGTPPRLAWRIVAWPINEPAEYAILVDAQDGTVIEKRNEAISHRRESAPGGAGRIEPSSGSEWSTLTDVADDTRSAFTRFTNGSGYVFDPDPLTSAGVPYGSPYFDGNDETNAQLDAERSLVTLPDISTDAFGQFVLEGPYVRIIEKNQSGQDTYSPPHLAGPNDFTFTRNEIDFEAVNAYYHIDASQRYVQSFGITDRQNAPIGVNPHGLTADDSFYFPNQNILVFGSGGVDDAEDASVLWHEYGHALLQAAAPGLLSTTEGHALHEGWSDYWAASYARHLWETGRSNRSDWNRVFRWDSGDGQIWNGRVLDHGGRYPEDICSAGPNPVGCSPHDEGRLWGTVLMEIYTDLGKAVTDELNLRSHDYLSAPATFSDAAEAIIQADVDYFDAMHVNVLLNHFGNRGLVQDEYPPTLSHDPVRWVENLGGTTTISAHSVGLSGPVESVILRYEDTGGSPFEVVLQQVADNQYEGEMDLSAVPGTMYYYLEVTDVFELTTVLPSTAPESRFELQVGPDNEAPALFHDPLSNIPFSTWPPKLEVFAQDNLGMDRVTAHYRIEDVFGEQLEEGMFELTADGDHFRGDIPVEQGLLPPFVQVFYWLEGVDAAEASNSTRLPSVGAYEFTAASDGVIRTVTFEAPNPAVTYSGSFERGTPTFGLGIAHSGSAVVGTALAGPYPSSSNVSRIELSRANLSGVSRAFLTFWHWYDMEHDGSAEPNSTGAQLWDGANLKMSTDGGDSWQLLVPEGGYNGLIAQSQTNPLSGEMAFGGYSYGWRQVIVVLPSEEDVRIRFEFGTDESNSDVARWFAGWYIDDLKITTERPDDTGLPAAVTLPSERILLSTDEVQPMVEAHFVDDNGISDVFVDYSYTTRISTNTGTLRMELDPSTVSRYFATFEFADLPAPSDRIEYVFRSTDHAGNESTFPGSGGAFEIEYRLEAVQTITNEATASGVWRRVGNGWNIGEATGEGVVSSVNLTPLDLPENSSRLELVITHLYDLSRDFGGNVKVSADGGTSWNVIVPADGYADQLNLKSSHPMDEEWAFSNDSAGLMTDRFSLDDYAGKQVRIRIDLATGRDAKAVEFWNITSIVVESATAEETFDVPRELALHAAYPNPFQTGTRVGYTIRDSGEALLELYDVLGRRVRTIVEGYHDAGTYEKTLSGSDLTAGVYVLRLISGGKQRVQTLVRVN